MKIDNEWTEKINYLNINVIASQPQLQIQLIITKATRKNN